MPVSKKFANFRNSKAKELKKYLQINLLAKLQYFAIIFSHVLYIYIAIFLIYINILYYQFTSEAKKPPKSRCSDIMCTLELETIPKYQCTAIQPTFTPLPMLCFKLQQKLISIRSDFPKYYLCLSHIYKCFRR